MVDANEFNLSPKGTIHNSGRLGFNRDAEAYLNLKIDSRLLLFRSEERGNYFMVVLPPGSDGNAAFPVKLASAYYSANLKAFFDAEQLPYASNDQTIIFDIVKRPEEYRGCPVFELKQRVVKRRVVSK